MPTKAELQATVNDLTRQLKNKEIHYKNLYASLNEYKADSKKTQDNLANQIRELSEELRKLKDDEAVVLRDEEIDRLKEALAKASEELQQHKLKNNPIDTEVKLRNIMRAEIADLKAKLEFVQDEHDAVVKKNEKLLKTCKTLGDQINTANGVAPITRPTQAEIMWGPDKIPPMVTEPQFTKEEVEFAQEQLKPWNILDSTKVVNVMYEQRQETSETPSGVAPLQPKDPNRFNLDDQVPDFTAGIPRLQPSPEMQKFASGAVRSSDANGVRFDLITPVGLRRLAETYKEGSVKYGDNNWQKGFPASDVMNHAIRHTYLWLDGDRTEDHLAHAAWGLFTVMHFEERKPECIDVTSRNPQH